MTAHVGNYVVSVRRDVLDASNGFYSVAVNTPDFIIGGVSGQAMTANDVVTSVLRMLGIPSSTSLFINGKLAVDNGTTEGKHVDQTSVWLQPAEDCGM